MISSLVMLLGQANVPQLRSDGLAGYVSMSVPAPPEGFGYGVSLYAAAWPLVERPLRDFQIGLASIWIVPDNREIEEPLLPKGTLARDSWPERGPSYRDVFQTIEGGLGFWASTRFGATTAKFRMNGTPNGYNHEISSPGWGFGDTKPLKPDQMGIAQLSNRLLVPPDGLTFQSGTNGELLGYAWMALPLVQAKAKTANWSVPTGDQCWTLFLNSQSFRGPVAFYTPATWSRISRIHPPAIGRGLDARPGLVTGGAIEINTVPRFVSTATDGSVYTKIPALQFPVDHKGRSVLIHNLTHYSKDALFNQVQKWMDGGPMPTGRFDLKGGRVPPVQANPLSVQQGEKHVTIRGAESWVETEAWDESTFGLHWNPKAIRNGKGRFFEYCHEANGELRAITGEQLPASTGLAQATFAPAQTQQAYEPSSASPKAKAGPFQVRLSDGSVVTYYWVRFIDQPSLQDANLSPADKAKLQHAVEQIHRKWTSDKAYMPPPKSGTLASLDGQMFVTPPKGMEAGYVPIVVRQFEAPSR